MFQRWYSFIRGRVSQTLENGFPSTADSDSSASTEASSVFSSSSTSSSSSQLDGEMRGGLHTDSVIHDAFIAARAATANKIAELDARIAECDAQLTSSEALVGQLDESTQRIHEEVETLLIESFDPLMEVQSPSPHDVQLTPSPKGGTDEASQDCPTALNASLDSRALWAARAAIEAQRRELHTDMISRRDALLERIYQLRIRLQTLRTQRARVQESLEAQITVVDTEAEDAAPLSSQEVPAAPPPGISVNEEVFNVGISSARAAAPNHNDTRMMGDAGEGEGATTPASIRFVSAPVRVHLEYRPPSRSDH